MDTFKLYLAGKIVDVSEAKMTPDQMKKREKIAKSIERDNPDMPMDKKMAIATKSAMDEGKMKDLAMKIDRVASNMKKDRMMKPFADKFKKDAMKSLNIRKSLEKVLPDYVAGKTLDKVMKESVNEMHCRDCNCEYGNIDPNCDCPNDGSNPEGKHWVKDTNEAMGARMHRMKAMDRINKSLAKKRNNPNEKDRDIQKINKSLQKQRQQRQQRSESFKVKDTVIPKVGPHKGVKHEIIHDFKDGTYNIKPIGLSSRQIKYRMGAAKAKKADLKSVKEAVEVNERNYRKEYDNYQGRPEQIANRSSRNSARRIMGDKAVKGMDVGHKDNNPLNNDPKNLQMEDPSENRREPRTRDVDEASKEGTIKIVKTKDNKFQVQRMTKGKFVNQGKPYKSQKDAEKVRGSGQHSMQFSHVEEKATDKRMRGWHKDYDFDQDRDIVKGFVSPKAKSMAKKIVKDAIPMNKAIQKIRSKFPGMKMDAISDLLKKEGLPQALKAKDTARRKEYNAFQKARRK